MVRRRLIAGIAIVLIGAVLFFIVKAKREREFLAEHTVNLAVGTEVNLPEERNPVLVASYDFDGPGDAEGWELRILEGPERMWIVDGMLHIRRDRAPRSRILKSVDLNAADVNLIELRVRRPLRRFSLSWLLGSGEWSPDFPASRAISAEEWRTISFPVGQSELWRGRITALRVNFDTGSQIKVPEFHVDSIRLLRDENPSFVTRPKRVGYVIADERQWVIPTELPGKFSREVEIPKGARLNFSCGLSKETWQSHPAEVVLRVSAMTEEGESHPLASLRLQPGALRGAWRWTKKAVDLENLAGHRATLTFEASSADNKPGGLVLWGNPIIEPSEARPARQPNIIVILIDALRPDHLGVYGYEQPISPNLDELAKEAIVFENAFAQAQCTHVSVASLFTSLFPLEAKEKATGYYNLKKEPLTLAERLEAAGYVNAAFSTNHLVHWDYGFDRGFETFSHHILPSRNLKDMAVGWLKDNPRRPFFLYLHLMDVHSPYEPPKVFRSRFVSSDYQPANPVISAGNAALVRHEMAEGRVLSPEDQDYFKSLYDAEIASTDWSIGLLFNWLKRTGLYDDTVIVVLADHGEEFWEHGNLGHTGQLYDELIRVPLILKLPKRVGRRGKRISATVRLVDVYPTLLELAGQPPPPGIRGESLFSVDSDDSRWQYAEIPRMRALRGEGWKLIDNPDPGRDELYNLQEDPAETNNVIADNPEIADRMQAEMDRLTQAWEPGPSESEEREQLDPKTIERLRSLGYIK